MCRINLPCNWHNFYFTDYLIYLLMCCTCHIRVVDEQKPYLLSIIPVAPKSDDFFDADNHAQLRFTGKKYESSEDEASLHGDLTIRGVTRPITLQVEYGGAVVDPYGQSKAGFTISGKISRKDFGLTWNAVTEAGQVVVSDVIKIHAEVQLVKQAGGETEAELEQETAGITTH